MLAFTCPAGHEGKVASASGDIPTCSSGGEWIELPLQQPPISEVLSLTDIADLLAATMLVFAFAAAIRWIATGSRGQI